MKKHFLLFVWLVAASLSGCFSVEEILGAIEACSNLTFDQIQQQDDISDECRDAIESLLPAAENNFLNRMIAFGGEIDETGEPVLYLLGIDANGNPLTASAFETATVSVTDNVVETQLGAGEFSVTTLENLSSDVVSISVVSDYSASMTDTDLDDAASIYTDVFNILPEIYEAEVILFSETVSQKLTFTDSKSAILSAVARDNSFTRSSTALYDGMGTALSHLIDRSRPIQILIVSTDGLENSSVTYTKSQLLQTLSDNGIFVVMMGALFSDVDEMEELAGSRGLFFYAHSFLEVQEAVQDFVNSLPEIVEIRIDEAHQAADSATVTVGTLSASFTF